MCLFPVTIKNPLYSRNSYASEFGSITEIPKHLMPSTEYIQVPCGKCDDCRNVYYNSLLQRCIIESMTSYMYFVTLTYDNEHIPSITLPTRRTIFYSDYSDVQNMFKRFRRHNIIAERDWRYICVNEFGDTYHRPHIHLLIFVAKLDTDNPRTTPHEIRQRLFYNLGKFFAENVGTFKNPIYEPLFTYKETFRYGRLHTNYFVKYVEDERNFTSVTTVQSDDDIFVKTIRYLIGYINKGSAFDREVEKELNSFPTGDALVRPLRSLLRSKVRYSKGLGCGYMYGRKHYLPRISVRSSLNTLYYSDIYDILPKTFAEFAEIYPHFVHTLDMFLQKNMYSRFKSLKQALRNFSYDDYVHHLILVKYFKNYMSIIYHRYFRDNRNLATISYWFSYYPVTYEMPRVKTCEVDYSPTFEYLRQGVRDGLAARVPFLAFRMNSNQTFTALCKYYKDRVCTISDYALMFQSVSVANYEEWQSLFIREKSLRKTNISHGNRLKYENNSENICISQKHCLVSHRNTSGLDLYLRLLSDCK